MTVLALDLGTSTGAAFSPAVGTVTLATWDLKPSPYENEAARFIRFRAHLQALHAASPIRQVWFELVRAHKGTRAAHVYGGLHATLMTWCQDHGVACSGVPVQTMKKFWTGKGNANKAAMVKEAEARGYEIGSEDEADAVALLTWALIEHGHSGAAEEPVVLQDEFKEAA